MRLLYQRWLEFDLPTGVPAGTIPMWSWPLPLSDGRTLVTLLYRPLGSPVEGRSPPRTVIIELSSAGDAEVWKPGVGYPAPVLFYVTPGDDLVGFDLTMPGKIYACRADGTHLWTLETRLRMVNLLAPAYFEQRENQLVWQHADGQFIQCDLVAGVPTNQRTLSAPPMPASGDVHHPHTHVVGNSLYVFDFDPMARVTRYSPAD